MTQQDTFRMYFACSVYDLPFAVTYHRKKGQEIYRIQSIDILTRVPEVGKPVERNSKALNIANEVDTDKVSNEAFCCPYCRAKSRHKAGIFVHCHACKTNVCSGRSGLWSFRCRKSCDNKARYSSFSFGNRSSYEILRKVTPKQGQLPHASKPNGKALSSNKTSVVSDDLPRLSHQPQSKKSQSAKHQGENYDE